MPRSNLPAIHRLILLAALLLAGCSPATTGTPVAIEPLTPLPSPSAEPLPPSDPGESKDVVLLSLEENGNAHLFFYVPLQMPLTRLTFGDWDDITPALSPDGTKVAFTSNRDGQWDLYLLDLPSGAISRLTDTPAYEGSPSWSPDNQWLACEVYLNENLEVAIISLNNPDQEPINLTLDPSSDHSPAWAPGGRHIAFVSNRNGDSDIWLADLDQTGENRYINLSKTPFAAESHPAWAKNGNLLAWASAAQKIGNSGVYLWDASRPGRPAAWIGEGDWPAWNANGDRLIAVIQAPNQTYLTSYTSQGQLLLQATPLPGPVRGLVWPGLSLPEPLPEAYNLPAAQTPTALWTIIVTPLSEGPSQRFAINPLQDVQAPYPQLHDRVDESFEALRQRVILEAGWDALAALSNAFVPLTTFLDPGLGEDWLYTGRAISLNPLMANAGWMVSVRQDIGSQTYWTLYLRTQLQDGTQGQPLRDPPWDLAARYDLDPRYYEQGGKYSPVPPGYWINFTSLAQQYGWERLPALPNWQTYYSGTRFTEFAFTGGLDWYSAMLEIYPQDILVTPTRILPPTSTPTRTPIPTRTPFPTRTPLPTFTPSPTRTPTPQPTFTPSITPTE